MRRGSADWRRSILSAAGAWGAAVLGEFIGGGELGLHYRRPPAERAAEPLAGLRCYRLLPLRVKPPAAPAQQVRGGGGEQGGIDLVARLHVRLGEDRASGRDPADHRQFEQPPVARAAALADLDAARGAGGDLQRAFALQRA